MAAPSVLKPGASTVVPASMPAISQRRPGTDAASKRFAIMAEHSISVLIENSIQIAWDFLERSGEIEDPVIASRFLCNSIELMVRQGVGNRLLLSNRAITAYQHFKQQRQAV
jgi:hypothetical protein